MPYKCKKCGRDVIVSYRRFEGDGKSISVSVEMPTGKIRDVEQCPICANPLMVYDDMEFIPPKKYLGGKTIANTGCAVWNSTQY